MRRLLVVLGLIASISGASAQEQEFEIPTLRGSDSYVPDAPGPLYLPRWSGFYVGGQVGYGVASMDFSHATQDLVAHELRTTALENEQQLSTWTALGKTDRSSASFGGFLGYNIGWDGVILGFELNYSRTNLAADAPNAPIHRVAAAGGNVYDVTVAGSASMRVTDFGTLRARAGFEVGNVLPFVMMGVAFGRADLARTATVSGRENPTPPPNTCDPAASPPCSRFSFSESESKNGAFIYGWALGGGVEVMIMPKVFLRTEYEYVAFSPIWSVKSTIQTARAGIGYKF
jgi:outer membrane immunogenic protein